MTPTHTRRHRHRRRRFRRSDLKWLVFGLLIPLPLLIGLLVLAQLNRDDAGKNPPSSGAAVAAAPAPSASPSAPCAFSGEAPKTVVEAAACGDLQAIWKLAAAGAPLAATDPRPAFAGQNAVHHASRRGDLSIVEMLLAAGVPPDAQDAQGNTPLHELALGATSDAEEAIGRALIRAGAMIGRRNARGLTALQELEGRNREHPSTRPLARLLREAEAGSATLALAQSYLSPASSTDGLELGLAAHAAKDTPQARAQPHLAPAAGAPRREPQPPPQTALRRSGATNIDIAAEVRDTIGRWADDWSRQDIGAYLSHYATDFHVPGGLDVSEWETLRRERITAPAKISVRVSDLRIEFDNRRATAHFVQQYESSGLSERSTKVLVLEQREPDAAWKIVAEYAEN